MKKIAVWALALALCLSLCTVTTMAISDPVAKIVRTGETYDFLKGAIENAEDDDVIEIVADCDLVTRTEITKKLTIKAEDDATVTMTLYGPMLIGNKDVDITVTLGGGSGTLTIQPEESNNFRPIAIRSDSVLMLEDGVVLANSEFNTGSGSEKNYGGMISVQNDAILTMDGGKITDSQAMYGGAVYVDGTFNMNGGTISQCCVTYPEDSDYTGRGGAVFVTKNGAFNMTGGTISDCTAELAGGAVYSSGAVSMTGGEIKNCKAEGIKEFFGHEEDSTKGGAVYMLANTMTMSGGTITTDNSADKGDGIYLAKDASFTMNGGSVNGLYIHQEQIGTAKIDVSKLTVTPADVTHTTEGNYAVYQAAGSDPITLTSIAPIVYHHSHTSQPQVVSTQTGDMGVALYAVLALTSAGALVGTKRKEW